MVLLTAISNALPYNSLWDPNKRIGSALLRQVRLHFTGGITAFHFLSLERFSEVPHQHNDVLSLLFYDLSWFTVITYENTKADVYMWSWKYTRWETATKANTLGIVMLTEIYTVVRALHARHPQVKQKHTKVPQRKHNSNVWLFKLTPCPSVLLSKSIRINTVCILWTTPVTHNPGFYLIPAFPRPLPFNSLYCPVLEYISL